MNHINQNNHRSDNFKQTEIGLIPEDWEVKIFTDIFSFLSTASYSRAEITDSGEIGEGSRSNKYKIENNFLNFWFRFIYKYRSAVEIGNLDYVRNIVERDYETYSGIMLEKYFRTVMMESKEFSDIQGYWNSKSENEIDIVAVNEADKRLVFCEVKRNPKRINLSTLESKAMEIVGKYPKFSIKYKGLSLGNM